jgi:hypothetical protein
LQDRVGNIMIVIVKNVAGDGEITQDNIAKAAKEMEKDIVDLKKRVFDLVCI